MSENLPLVSLITVTYNAGKYLERTIQSVISQKYPRIEYIIIDGKSTDNTLEIIKKYEKHLSNWISEPDAGLYDAMNKGQKLATGEYLWFMNAGDRIFSENTLQEIFDNQPNDADVYFGEAEFHNLEDEYLGLRSDVMPFRLPEKLHWKSLQRGMVVCHQAFLVKRKISPEYDLNHSYCADVDWVIRCLKRAKDIIHTHQILAVYLQGGYSRKFLLNSLLDRFKVLSRHYGFFKTVFNHFFILLRSIQFILFKRKTY